MVRERQVATAFGGEGSRLYGGRWNSPGVRMVYTSGTRALAGLETLVHLIPPIPFRYFAIPVEFDDDGMESWPSNALPKDWTEHPVPTSTQSLGDAWVREARSLVLEVPSVFIPNELNYLINPEHPDFKKVSIGKPEPFAFDPRLF